MLYGWKIDSEPTSAMYNTIGAKSYVTLNFSSECGNTQRKYLDRVYYLKDNNVLCYQVRAVIGNITYLGKPIVLSSSGSCVDLSSAKLKNANSTIIECPNKIKWNITTQITSVELKIEEPIE